MRSIKWIAMVGLLCALPATAFAQGWREPERVRVVEPRPVVVQVGPRVEVEHHRWARRPYYHRVWVRPHYEWVSHHRTYRHGYWERR